MKTIKQLSVFLENKPGHVYKICKTLGDAGVNIYSLSLADTSQFGILRLIVKDTDEASKILVKAGFIVNIATDVLAIKIENKPGLLAQVSEVLSENNVNLEYAYAFANRNIFIYRVSDNEVACNELIKKGFTLLDSQELFNTNN